MSGYQLSGNAPDAYVRYASHVMAPWTDDLIAQARCASGDHVLDVACGTGFVSNQLDPNCKVTGIDVNEGMLAVPGRIPTSIGIQAARSNFHSSTAALTLCCVNKVFSIFRIALWQSTKWRGCYVPAVAFR
jgi:trans-aconitate methyltransferase